MRRFPRLLFTAIAFIASVAGLLPVNAQEALYMQRGSLVRVIMQGQNVQILIEEPGSVRGREGARAGDLLFSGTVSQDYAEGMAWKFDTRCGNIDYYVYGDLRLGRAFTLTGAAPVYGNGTCRIVDNVSEGPDARLAFELVQQSRPASTPTAPAVSLGNGVSVCVVNVNTTLNLRIGPGTQHPVIYELPARQCTQQIAGDCQSGWCPVLTSRGEVGWASAAYLSSRR
jgi:hypothetical protein